MPAIPPRATLLSQETAEDSGWQCVTTIWQAEDTTHGVSVHAFTEAEDGASIHALAEGLSTLDELETALSEEILEAERFDVPATLIRNGVTSALTQARQTVTP